MSHPSDPSRLRGNRPRNPIGPRCVAQDDAHPLEYQARLPFHVANSPLAIIEMDPAGRIMLWSTAAERILGYREQDVLGKTWEALGLVVDTDKEAIAEHERMLREGTLGTAAGCHRLRTKAGEIIWADWHASVLHDDHGNTVSILAAVSDATRRVEMQERLRSNEERLSLVIAATRDLIWDWDITTNHVWRSAELLETFGPAPDSHTDEVQWWLDRVHPEDLDRMIQSTRELLASDRTHWNDFYRFRRRDGSYAYVEDRGYLVRDESGRAVRAIGAMADISDRRRVEQQLARYQEQLEALVERRTNELEASREQARQAERLASIGVLAAGIAHEINNPLGMMLLQVERALQSVDPADETHHLLADVKAEVRRCSRIVKNVLQFARERRTEKWSCDLESIVMNSIELTRTHAARHGLDIETRVPSDLPLLMANSTDLEQVFVNLIENAAHASRPQGHLSIEARTDGGHIRVTIEDNGCGMSQQDADQAFNPFFTTRLSHGGTGLGLSTVHGIIAEHGGTIQLDTQLGRGTRITINLPAQLNGKATEASASGSNSHR